MKATQRFALVMLDAQNDFLHEAGAFSKQCVSYGQFTQTLVWILSLARQQHRTIVCVTSVYGEVAVRHPSNELTHSGTPCCIRGSWGAQLVENIQGAILGHSEVVGVEKQWYSAFRDTDLHERLQRSGVDTLVLCGVANRVSVLATVRDARDCGYSVEVLSDATTASTQSKHTATLREAEKLGARLRSWSDLFSDTEDEVVLEGLGAGDTSLVCGALHPKHGNASVTYETLEHEVTWNVMYHRGGEVPRLVAVQGEMRDGIEPLYRHPVDGQPAMYPWTPYVDQIRRAVEARVGHPLNHCLLQLYRNGRDWISEHSDKTLDVVRPSSIVNVSLGRTRTMLLRPKLHTEESGTLQKIHLPHGSMFVMGLETNRRFYHSIKQEGGEANDGPRISLTFRHIGTWYERTTGAVWGVGTVAKNHTDAVARKQSRASCDVQQQTIVDRSEAEAMLKLFREENVSTTFDAASYLPGFDIVDLRVLNEIPEK
jgi:nicotinamidase-related amidase/alkylated DNA repair dioxygenase AlkB